ncbi:MAG: site-specific integrase [Saprospiraceae bacterium]|nr:site-specific integrase [Candidatus Vicinibacter affinis]
MKIGKASYYFFLRNSRINSKGKAPIHCRIKIMNETKVMSTGVMVELKNWNNFTLTVNQKRDPISFLIIERWRVLLLKTFTKAFLDNEIPNLNQVLVDLGVKKENINPVGFVEVYKIYLEGIQKQINQNYTLSTFNKFKTIYNHLKEYLIKVHNQKEILLKELKIRHLLEFEEYMTIDLKLKQITINKSIQRLKSIIKYAIAHEYLDKDPWMAFKSKPVHINIKYLTKKELQKLEAIILEDNKLNKVRDIFIFACYTGFGYSELKQCSIKGLEEKSSILWLSVIRQKTKKIQKVPLLPKALKIWTKYGGKLPVMSNQKMNQYLKDIGKICEFETPLTTHLARKTFASTVLLGNNVPIKVVSTLLSHSDSRITEKHYAEIQQDVLTEEVLKLFKL